MKGGPGRPPGGGGGRNRRRRGRRPRSGSSNPAGRDQQQSGVYSAPMDHSYRATMAGGNNGARPGRQRPGFAHAYPQPEPAPSPMREDATSRIFAFVDDLFFKTKITETARTLNVKFDFVKSETCLGASLKRSR